MASLKSRLAALEAIAPKADATAQRITELLAAAYRRKHGHPLPHDMRRGWLDTLSTSQGMSQFRQAWTEAQREHRTANTTA